jgi:hypothetical protein
MLRRRRFHESRRLEASIVPSMPGPGTAKPAPVAPPSPQELILSAIVPAMRFPFPAEDGGGETCAKGRWLAGTSERSYILRRRASESCRSRFGEVGD